jgi:DNA repair protein RadA/Sms
MAKQKYKTIYRCSSCGREESKWLGRCPGCGSWNTFTEEVTAPLSGNSSQKTRQKNPDRTPVLLSDIPLSEDHERFSSGNSELDRVLGGGIMNGCAVLLGGEPGIGKSTLLLHMLSTAAVKNVLYISGEESPVQIRMRADRLQLSVKHVKLLNDTHLEQIMAHVRSIKPKLLVVDSIQTLFSEELGQVPGTVNQVKYACMELTDWAKMHQAAVFFIGHVTKDGAIAGPKVIEHMVDTVLNFEQADTGVRIVRASKNRFGSVDEIGVFTMEERGLIPVPDPASFFLGHRQRKIPPGSVTAAVFEGTRTLMVEIQALAVPAKSGYSRVYSDRIDNARVSRVAAVLEKHVGIPISDHDLYVNVAGGIRLNEVGIELPLALALYSAVTGSALKSGLVAVGELSLAGEVRPVRYLDSRIKASDDMGFLELICPGSRRATSGHEFLQGETRGKIHIRWCSTIQEAVHSGRD